jgi:hypothetical protein
MNSVNLVINEFQSQLYKLRDLVLQSNRNPKETAFMGKCGVGNKGLYLITRSAIVLAEKPSQSWCLLNNGDMNVHVDYFVDISITVTNKK